jgi:hypothetical protein
MEGLVTGSHEREFSFPIFPPWVETTPEGRQPTVLPVAEARLMISKITEAKEK